LLACQKGSIFGQLNLLQPFPASLSGIFDNQKINFCSEVLFLDPIDDPGVLVLCCFYPGPGLPEWSKWR
jgi:hypothetical protein